MCSKSQAFQNMGCPAEVVFCNFKSLVVEQNRSIPFLLKNEYTFWSNFLKSIQKCNSGERWPLHVTPSFRMLDFLPMITLLVANEFQESFSTGDSRFSESLKSEIS